MRRLMAYLHEHRSDITGAVLIMVLFVLVVGVLSLILVWYQVTHIFTETH
jgi:hypothetical protein